MTALGLDTSVAVPLLVQTHRAHQAVVRWWAGREVALSGHALAETYSVLSAYPATCRWRPADAARLLDERFREPLTDRAADGRPVPEVLARLGIVGGAVYDALVALAAFEHGLDVATRTAVPGRPTKPSARVLLSPADRGWWPTWAQSHDQRCL